MKENKFTIFYNYFWIFIAGCVAGWIIEGLYTLVTQGIIINHSALVIGPFNVAYGLGSVLLTLLLNKFQEDSPLKIFAISYIGGNILEYVMSWGMELVLNFTAWDYSDWPLNINGRISLVYGLFWGILGVLWIKLLYPRLIQLIRKMNFKIGKRITIILLIFLLFDLGLTVSAIVRAKSKDAGIVARNGYEEFLDKTFNREYLDNMFCGNWGD